MRADARRNHDRLLAEARATFRAEGTDAPLEDVARRAGVGIGTLYRHFPTRVALVDAVYQDEVTALQRLARDLPLARTPEKALATWLAAVLAHAAAYAGVSLVLVASEGAVASSRGALLAAGGELLARAQAVGAVRADVGVHDLLQLATAIGIAAERNPGDQELGERLLDLALTGLRSTNSASAGP